MMDPYHVIIFGTRTFNDYPLLKSKMDLYTRELEKLVVCTGEWRGIGKGTPQYIGADLLGEQWASEKRFLVRRFEPDFVAHKPPACFHIRNREMVQHVAGVNGFAVGFWDGRSTGTASVIELCRDLGVRLKVVRYGQ